MRILFFSHYFPPEGNAPATRVHSMCRRWVEAGHEVTVITSAPNVPHGVVYEGYKNKLRQKEEVDGIEVIRVWTWLAANKGTYGRIANFVSYMLSALFFSFFVRRPEIIISTSPQFFCGWAGVLRGRLSGIRNVLEVRDIWPESVVAVGAMSNRNILAVFEWLEIKMYDWSNHIVTVGDGYREKLLQRGVASEKISIVTNGLDKDQFEPREACPEILSLYGLKDKFVVSYSGTVGMASGLDVVLRAAKHLKELQHDDIVFKIVGDGAEKERLEEEARQADLGNVIFTGRQPKEKMSAFLASSDVSLVHLKKSELFKTVLPSKIFEAAGMARPMIVGVDGQARGIIERSGGGLYIEPENDKQLVEAVLKLKSDPVSARLMGESGRDYILKNFDRDKLAEDYRSILHEQVFGDGVAEVRF